MATSNAIGVVAIVALFAAVVVIGTLITLWAWNILIAGVFHGPTIDFWQALAVNIIVSVVRGAANRD